jgi:hypothetical protein
MCRLDKEDDMKTFGVVTPFLKALRRKKEEVHKLGGFSLLKSLAGCKKQHDHMDYMEFASKVGTQSGEGMPYVGLIALEDNTTLYVDKEKVDIPKGSCLLMRGSVIHAGSDYVKSNMRFHFYMDTPQHVASHGEETNWQ